MDEQATTQAIDELWLKHATKELAWSVKPSLGGQCDLRQGHISWFADGQLNVCYNCVDRHLAQQADKIALIFESDDGQKNQSLTYQQLYNEVIQFAASLQELGIKPGDRVCIYLPMIPLAVVAMLACARIGAIHSVVFAGFSAQSLAHRIDDAQCTLLITATGNQRGGKTSLLKETADQALELCEQQSIEHVLVIPHLDCTHRMQDERDIYYDEQLYKNLSREIPCYMHSADDYLFMLYTSGSTGKPKGVLHSTGGYLLYCHLTFKTLFDYKDNDIYWCSADIGWITGHSYIVYGPLSNAATVLIFEGVPNYPTPARAWEIIDKHQVSIFYTAPTAIRALMREGDDYVEQTSRASLRILGSVGEPINPAAWQWYHDVVGNKRCPILDTWWQTETGGILISPQVDQPHAKPGAATQPFTGIEAAILDEHGKEIQGAGTGSLVIKNSWPAMMRGVYGDQQRFIDTYLAPNPGYYTTGDQAHRDEDGDYWITGRLDDVLNVSGHRLSTAEIESALVKHPLVAEAAVIGISDDVKGQAVCSYVTLIHDTAPTTSLSDELKQQVANEIGAIARPAKIIFTDALPKTRSGKIMRRILRKLANGEQDLGDTSTLADPSVVEQLKLAMDRSH